MHIGSMSVAGYSALSHGFWKAAIETAMHPLFSILILGINVRTGHELQAVLSIRKVSIHTCIEQTLACIISQSLLILMISSFPELPKGTPTYPRLPNDFASLFCELDHATQRTLSPSSTITPIELDESQPSSFSMLALTTAHNLPAALPQDS